MDKKANAPKGTIKIFIFLAIFFLALAKANFVFALEIKNYPSVFGISLPSNPTLDQYVCYLAGLIAAFSTIISAIAIAWGGIHYLIAYTGGKFTDEGKNMIKSGILGLLIVVSASLILYVMNPELSTCTLGVLSEVIRPFQTSTSNSPNLSVNKYQEIPIGTLTETLLTRTMDCYAFDPLGNPINGTALETNNNCKQDSDCSDGGTCNTSTGKCDSLAPTYIDHDRADCLLQLVDGAQKKSQVIAGLSNEITKLMDTCSCQGKCDDDCGGQAGCNDPPNAHTAADGSCNPAPAGVTVQCTGKCVKHGCKEPAGAQDCCPAGVKDKIEHGDIQVGCGANNGAFNNIQNNIFADDVLGNNKFLLAQAGANAGNACCDIPLTTFHGLDEFRCKPDPAIPNGHQSCDDVVSFVEKQTQINGNTVTIIDLKKWAQLNLIQQLTYYKDKIDDLKQKIQQDKTILDQARSTLAQCYLAIPYVDLLKNFQGTDQGLQSPGSNQTVIITQDSFSDLQTNKPINAGKYCNGFNYNNSSCLKKCDDECPDDSSAVVSQYKSCDGSCVDGDEECLNQQEACIEKVYGQRPCPYAPAPQGNTAAPKTFNDCITACQNDCSNDCTKKYLPCEGEYTVCQNQCTNNSQCVLNNGSSNGNSDNEKNCLLGDGAQGFVDCANQVTDQGNTKYCINNAYVCKNGSNEYAGYQDCSGTTTGTCSQGYSASFFYNNPNCQKCPDPYNSPPANGSCSKTCAQDSDCGTNGKCNNGECNNSACQALCPEVTKCPKSSSCPECPCDQIQGTVNFSVPNQLAPNPNTGDFTNDGNPSQSTASQTISAYEIVGPQCDKYSYNDDPLTFYCESSPEWYNDPQKEGTNPIPLGTERICSAKGEVPVGQTVDAAENWANGIIKTAANTSDDTQKMLTLMNKIGTAKDTDPIQDYCKCPAKFDLQHQPQPGGPICQTNCQYNQQNNPIPMLDANGNIVGFKNHWTCSCLFTACQGSPCQQIIDYLSQVWNNYGTLKIDYITFYTTMLQEPRSDIMKMLTYSRQQTNSCSVVNSAYALDARLFDCSRVEDEQMNPINTSWKTFFGQAFKGYCYGKNLGNNLDPAQSLTDNWFCCQEWQQNPTTRNQPQ